MASRYLDWLHRDVQPEVPRELTKKEKFYNWWDYHFWYVLAGAALLALGGYILWHALGIGQVKPDYQAAYAGTEPLSEEAAAALERILGELGEDANGDGAVVVQLNQYPSGGGTREERTYAYAVNMKILADLEACQSYIFLLEDPEAFQVNFNALQPLDGSNRESAEAGECCVLWKDVPGAAELFSGEDEAWEQVSGLYLARRGFWTERTAENLPACEALWGQLIGD